MNRPFQAFGHLTVSITHLHPTLPIITRKIKQYSRKEMRRTVLLTTRNSLSGDFDELFHQLHSLAQLAAEQNLRGHPQLDLVAALQQEAEVHRVLPTSLSAECEIDQLLLKDNVFMPVFIFSTQPSRYKI